MATNEERAKRKKRLSNLIKKVTTAYGLTNVALANELGIDPTTFQHWALGNNSPNSDDLYHSIMADLRYFLRKLDDTKPELPKVIKNTTVEPEPEPEFQQQELPLTTALDIQIGGSHYKDTNIQPVQYIEANHLGFLEGCMLKRLTRHDKPTGKGRQDIEKVIHEAQLLLELRYGG